MSAIPAVGGQSSDAGLSIESRRNSKVKNVSVDRTLAIQPVYHIYNLIDDPRT